ncbi:RAMP superfamily CRISPR-associated protein [Thermococcus sp.]
MSWCCYLTIFRAEAPLHIGYKQIGILKTTRYYIPGRTMWGAITANLTRALFKKPTSNDYTNIGRFVKEYIRTSYFYLAVSGDNWLRDMTDFIVDDNKTKYGVFLPMYTNKGLQYGELSKEEFEQLFVGSFVSTALTPDTWTAEEGSLHEFEYIKDKVRYEDEIFQVYWIGYLFLNEDSDDFKIECQDENVIIEYKSQRANLRDILNIVFVGGERNYGMGRLKLEHLFKISKKDEIFGKYDVEGIKLKIKEDLPIPAHLNIGRGINKNVRGEIEPIVGLEWSEKGAGQKVSKAIICVTPGSKLEGEHETTIGEYGILEYK